METKTNIEYYSELLEDDIVLHLDVEYEIDNDSFEHEFGTEVYPDYVRVDKVKVINTNLSPEVLEEAKLIIDDEEYDEKIADNIETELGNY